MAAGVEIIVDAAELPKHLIAVYGDENRVRQCLLNIMDNAVRYSAAPGGREVRRCCSATTARSGRMGAGSVPGVKRPHAPPVVISVRR